MQDLPLPPFGLVVEAFQKENIKLHHPIYLFVGKNAFEEAKINKSLGVLSLCLPYQKSLEDYRWPILNQKIIIIDTGGLSILGIKRMCNKLLKLGSSLVVLYSDSSSLQIFTPLNIKKDIL